MATEDRDTLRIVNPPRYLQTAIAVKDDAVLDAGKMVARDENGELVAAADTLGLRVLGILETGVDNAADGETATPAFGVQLFDNSSSNPLVQAHIGQPCYVEDDETVAADSTNLVPAGLVVDVTSDGVWVQQDPVSLGQALRNARPKVITKTAAYTITAAEAHQGNMVIRVGAAGGSTTITLAAVATGQRFGLQRGSATAGDDVVGQAGSGDTVAGSAAAGTITNDTDAVSDFVWLEAVNENDLVIAAPYAADYAEWAAS